MPGIDPLAEERERHGLNLCLKYGDIDRLVAEASETTWSRPWTARQTQQRRIQVFTRKQQRLAAQIIERGNQ